MKKPVVCACAAESHHVVTLSPVELCAWNPFQPLAVGVFQPVADGSTWESFSDKRAFYFLSSCGFFFFFFLFLHDCSVFSRDDKMLRLIYTYRGCTDARFDAHQAGILRSAHYCYLCCCWMSGSCIIQIHKLSTCRSATVCELVNRLLQHYVQPSINHSGFNLVSSSTET